MAEKKQPEKNKGGRPKGTYDVEINYEYVQGLARILCTEEEIAGFVGLTPEGFRVRKKADEALASAVDKGKRDGRASLRRMQYKVAMGDKEEGISPDKGMLIWLGKQVLGQKEPKQAFEHTGKVKHEHAAAREKLAGRLDELAARRQTKAVAE